MSWRDSEREGWDYFLDLDRQSIAYDNGYWTTFRVSTVRPSEGRPHGIQYSLSLHDGNGDRLVGYNNAHAVDVATGPARKSKRPKPFDHINRRGKKPVPYAFTTPFKLLEDFFTEVDEILREEGVL
jgi:hypothetical protein